MIEDQFEDNLYPRSTKDGKVRVGYYIQPATNKVLTWTYESEKRQSSTHSRYDITKWLAEEGYTDDDLTLMVK